MLLRCCAAVVCWRVSAARGGSVSLWRVEWDQPTGCPLSVVPVYTVETGAYGFFRPSLLCPPAPPAVALSSSSRCCDLCSRALLLSSSHEASTLLLLDCATGATIARLETEARQLADGESEAAGASPTPLPAAGFIQFERRYGMVMSAQLFRMRGEVDGSALSGSTAEPLHTTTNAADRHAGCALYAVCGMESGHLAVFRLSVPSACQQPHVLARPLVSELKLHNEPSQSTATLPDTTPSLCSPASHPQRCSDCQLLSSLLLCAPVRLCPAMAVLAVRLCVADGGMPCVSPRVSGESGQSGECGLVCVTGSPTAHLQPVYVTRSLHSSAVSLTPLEPVALSMDDSDSSPSDESASAHCGINCIEWCHADRTLATAGWDGRVRLFSVTSVLPGSSHAAIRLLAVLRFHTGAAHCVAFAPTRTAQPAHSGQSDGRLVASSGLAVPAALTTAPTGGGAPSRPPSLSPFSHLSSLQRTARSVLLSVGPQATLLASGGEDHRIALYWLDGNIAA